MCFAKKTGCWLAVFVVILPQLVAQVTQAPQDGNKTVPIQKVTKLRVRVLLEEPFVMKSKSDPNKYEGMFMDILDELCSRAKLTYNVTLQGDQVYGYEYTPGNWTGLIGSIQSQESDLAVAPLSLRSKRQEVVDFTLPIMSAGLRILYKTPDPWTDSESFAILLSPFTAGLWVVIFLMFLSVSVLFYVVGRFSPYEDHAFVGKAATYEGLTVINSLLYTFSSLTFQGYTAAPRSISGRILAVTWWMFVMLVIAAYVASLCAIFLAFKPSVSSLPFTTFEELAQQDDVAYGIVRGGMTESYLNQSKRALQSRLWGTMKAHSDQVFVNSIREGLYRVQKSNGKYALIMEGPVAEYLSGQPPCELMTLGEELSEHSYAFACNKQTDVCSNMNTAILQMLEEDVIYDLKEKWFHKGCNREDSAEYIFRGLAYFDTFGQTPNFFAKRAVTLRRFSTGFLVLFIGMLLSGCVLLAEIFYSKKRGIAVPQRMPRADLGDQERIDREFRDEDT